MSATWKGVGRAIAASHLVAVVGCSQFIEPRGPEIAVSLIVDEPRRAVFAAPLVLSVDLSDVAVQVAAGATDPGIGRADVRGARYGDVPVHVRLLGQSSAVLAEATFSQGFERDNLHWIAAMVGQRRPLGFCVGALIPVPISGGATAAAATDTMFVMYGRIPRGAVC